MSLDKNFPVAHPLARIETAGVPWHGLVAGGSLQLPNGTAMAYPQPDHAWEDMAGTTHRIKVPGIAEVVRTPEQAALDEITGAQWRNEAMLSGGDHQLFGRPLGEAGWIYIDSAGDRWWCRLIVGIDVVTQQRQFAFSAPLELSVSMRKFGAFGAAPEEYVHTASLSDWGQQGYSEPIYWHESGLTPTPLTYARLLIDGIQPDGSAVALMMHARSNVDACVRHPLGWIQLSISGLGASSSISLSVLKSRSQTIDYSGVRYNSGTGCWFCSFRWVEDGGAVHVKEGFAYTPEERDTWSDGLPPPGSSWSATSERAPLVVRFTSTQHVEGVFRRLLAIWPDGSGGWKEVAVKISATVDFSAPLPDIVASAGGLVHSTLARSESYGYSMVISLDHGAVSVSEVEYLMSQSTSKTVSESELVTSSVTDSTVNGVLASVSDTVTTPAPTGVNFARGGSWLYEDGSDSDIQIEAGHFNVGTAGLSVGTYGNGDVQAVAVIRYSGNLLGFRMTPSGGSAADYLPVVTPNGLYGSTVTRPLPELQKLMGSWCPFTGAVSWIQTSPVCWV